MARNLHRVLTSYVAIPCIVDHPAVPRSGDICRVGTMAGLALIDEQFGYGAGGTRELSGFVVNKPINPIGSEGDYPDGTTPIMFQMNEVLVDVYNADAAAQADIGDPVYYVDTAEGPTGDLNYHSVAGGAGNSDAVLGVLRESIAAASVKKAAVVMVLPTPTPNLTRT